MVKISIQEQDDKMVAVFDGRLDTPSTPEAGKALEPLLQCDDKDVISTVQGWITSRRAACACFSTS